MKFNDTQPIFLQIAEWIYERILSREWSPGERIPSVRDLAMELEVNPNTVMRTYERLQADEVIFNKRGIGYFLSEQAYAQVQVIRRKDFVTIDLPNLFKNMEHLSISLEDIEREYQHHLLTLKNETHENK